MDLTNLKGSAEQIVEIIERVKGKSEKPDISLYKNQLDPKLHKVMDTIFRPNRKVKKDVTEKDLNGKVVKRTIETDEPVNRVAIALQKSIVERAVAFLFGNEPIMSGETEDADQKKVFDAVSKIKISSKVENLNRQVARAVFSCTECAEHWFHVDSGEIHAKYGVATKFKLRVRVFNPLEGYTLFPYFDETGDLAAFGVEYSRKISEAEQYNIFEVFTKDHIAKLRSTGPNSWVLEDFKNNPLEKIPIVYAKQEEVEWESVQGLIERLETLLSNFAETNDYHAAPKIFIQGKLLGFASKGDSGTVLEGEPGSSASYLSWDHAPESVKLEIETLMSNIFALTQTPNISFDNVKGIGGLTGIALKLLFLDAHLKVKNKEEIFSPYLQRRNSILTSFIPLFNVKLRKAANSVNFYDTIKPYMIEDIKEAVEVLMAANGNQPIISQEKSVELSPFEVNAEDDYKRIQEETKQRNQFDITESTF